MQYSNPSLPSNLYTNGAVNFDTHQLANMLYMEHRQRRAQQQADDKQLNALTQGALTGVFAPDQGEAVEKYDKWRGIRKSVLFDKKLHKDREGFAKAQTSEQEAFKDYMDFTGRSKARHEEYKTIKGVAPDQRHDLFGARAAAYAQTPMSKLGVYKEGDNLVDLSNQDSYRNLGLDYDSNKLHGAALGKEVEQQFDGAPAAPDSLMKKVNIYARRENNPSQMESIFFNAASEQKGKKYLQAQAALLTPEVKAQIDDAIAKVPEDVWKAAGGKVDLAIKHPELPESVAANYLAKKAFLDNPPRLKETKDVLDLDKQRKFKLEDDKKMEALKHGYRASEIKLRDSLKDQDAAGQQSSVDTWLQGLEAGAIKAGKPLHITKPDKSKKYGDKEIYVLPVPPGLSKSFERVDKDGNKVQPDILGIDKDGNYYPQYYRHNWVTEDNKIVDKGILRKNGDPQIDEDLSVALTRDAIKPDVANTFLTPTMTEKNMGDSEDEDAAPAPTRTQTKNASAAKKVKPTKGMFD